MTIENVYEILRSRSFFGSLGTKKFRFILNNLYIDRRTIINYDIYEENQSFYLNPDIAITDEKELRIEIGNSSPQRINLYGKINGEKLITLE